MYVAQSMIIYFIIYSVIFTAIGVPNIPRTIGVIQPIILFLMIAISRGFARFWLGDGKNYFEFDRTTDKVLIYGAGDSGRQLASVIAASSHMSVAGFVDDDISLQGRVLNGIPIYKPEELEFLAEELSVKSVLLAMPKIDRNRRNFILSQMGKLKVSVRTLPSVTDLARGKIQLSDIQDLDIDDLLGRDAVLPDWKLMEKSTAGKIILVTGSGGSIGSELCRQIAKLKPKKLLLLDQNELALYNIQQELEELNSDISLIPLLADIQDRSRLREIVSAWLPDTVYHAAAYKHVPLVEHNFVAGIKNNVFGTLNLAEVILEYKVKQLVLISTDKAVRPTNLMGATKRLSEMILQALAENSKETVLSMVRFGNVLGSSGSVVPKFREQIHKGGPLTITHPEMVRYFMSIPEAAQLVIQAGAMAKGGDVFVLDMGEPVKIMDLAKKMIELSGFSIKSSSTPDGDIEIKITELRPGEKLYEELLIGKDSGITSHSRIMKASETYSSWPKLETSLSNLSQAIDERNIPLARKILKGCVSGYQPTKKIVDLVFSTKS